jgi:hypothetical protein
MWMIGCYFGAASLQDQEANMVTPYEMLGWWVVFFVHRFFFGTGGFVKELASFAMGTFGAYVAMNLMGSM